MKRQMAKDIREKSVPFVTSTEARNWKFEQVRDIGFHAIVPEIG
jgi:hypothetical protein